MFDIFFSPDIVRLIAILKGAGYGTPNAERRTPNAERRTPNAERRTPNVEGRGASKGGSMAADLWVVEFAGEVSCTVRHDVANWLAAFDVCVLRVEETLKHKANTDFDRIRPCAVVGLAASAQVSRTVLLERAARLATLAACVIVDETFDERLGGDLLRVGVQEYLDVTRADETELIRRIEYAVVRNESRECQGVGCRLKPVDWQRTNDIYHGLPRREREVLDLLIALRDPKQIARELGTGWTTVRTQTKNIREKFGVASTQQLITLVLHTLYQRPASDHQENLRNGQNDDCSHL